MSIELKDKEIKSILAEVTASLQAARKSEAEKLSKAIDGEEPPADDESAAPAESAPPAAPEASDAAPAAAPEMSDAPPADAGAGMPPDAGSAPADAGAMGDASADPAADQAPASPEMLAQEYAKLDDEQLKMHYMAAKQAVFERMQGAQSAGSPDQSAPPAASPDQSAVASPPAAGPAMKAEATGFQRASTGSSSGGSLAADGKVAPVTPTGSQKLDQATGPGANLSAKTSPTSDASKAGLVTEAEVAKSEQVQNLEAQIEGLAKAVTLLMNPPATMRKAVTSVAVLERTEALDKSEKKPAKAKMDGADMKAHLSDLIRSGKLSKNEKAAVLSFYETKNPVHLEKISHLFE